MDERLNQAWALFMKRQPSQAKKLVEGDFNLNTCQNFSFINLMGYLNLEDKNYETAREIYIKYISLAQEKNDNENLHMGFHQLAMVYREMGNYEQALDLIEEEKKTLTIHYPEDRLKMSINNYEQAHLRLNLGRYEKALKYGTLCLEQALQTEDKIAQACAYKIVGEVNLALNKMELAKVNIKKAIELFEDAGDDVGAEEVRHLLNI